MRTSPAPALNGIVPVVPVRPPGGLKSSVKFPPSYDGKFFATEFGRRFIKTININANGTPGTITNFPWTGTQVMDYEFGPDGALYVLDYGTGWFGGDANSAVYRIEYQVTGGNRPPVAVASGNPTGGTSQRPGLGRRAMAKPTKEVRDEHHVPVVRETTRPLLVELVPA